MRSLRREAEKPMKKSARPGLFRRSVRKLKHGFVACAAAAAMTFCMPLLDSNARAQPPNKPPTKKIEKKEKARPPGTPAAEKPEKVAVPKPASTATAKQLYTVKGDRTTLTNGNKTETVYFLTKTTKPIIKLNGPAKITLRLYPAVLRARFANGMREYARKIECSSGPAGGTQVTSHYVGKTRMSNIKHPDVANTLVIGTPMQFTAEVGKGKQEFRVLSPHGFLGIVSITPIIKAAKRTKPRPRLKLNTEGKLKVKKKTKKEPRRKESTLLFSSSGERFQFRPVKLANTPEDLYRSGDAYLLNVLGHIPLGKTAVSMLVGAYVTSYGFVLDMPASKTTFRSFSVDVSLGVGYRHGKHYVIALPFVGYRNIQGNISAKDPADSRTDKEKDNKFEAGGAAGYSYNPYFSVLVSGSSNPFHPLSARLHGELPWGWVKSRKPGLDVDFNWFRTVKSLEGGDMTGGGEISGNEFDIRAMADLPIYGIRGVALHALAGLWASSEHATGIFGGKLSVALKGVDIQLSGLSSIEGVPLVLFSVNYRR